MGTEQGRGGWRMNGEKEGRTYMGVLSAVFYTSIKMLTSKKCCKKKAAIPEAFSAVLNLL